MVPEGGNDPPTPTLSRLCSATELLGHGRSGEIRTPDSWFRRPELFR